MYRISRRDNEFGGKNHFFKMIFGHVRIGFEKICETLGVLEENFLVRVLYTVYNVTLSQLQSL